MGPRRIYLDNAATSFPKPRSITEAMMCYAQMLGASAGRGGYSEAVETGRLINECRQLLKRFFKGESANHFVFTLNCTDALNLAIKGLVDPQIKSHVICTAIDHNSILRPIHALMERGFVERTIVPVEPTTGFVDPEAIRQAIRPDTKFIAVTHVSNVTGTCQPVREIGRIAREHAVPFIVDGAQSVGHVPIDLQADCIDLLAAPGHKALLGPLGTGFLYVRPGLEKMLRPLREGGTGSASELPTQPQMMPDKYESGSQNAIGIIGLAEGVKWLMDKSMEKVQEEERELMRAFIDGISTIPGLRYFGPPTESDRTGVFSVRIDGIDPADLANEMEEQFGVLTRAGLHCAPHIHEALGTADTGGTTRFSFGPFVTLKDIQYAADSLAQIAEAHVAV